MIDILVNLLIIAVMVFMILYVLETNKTPTTRLTNNNKTFQAMSESIILTNPFDKIDQIYVISSTNNYFPLLQDLSRIGIPRSIVQHTNSHDTALQDARSKNYDTCMIFKDDFRFTSSRETILQQLNRFFAMNIEWDVVSLVDNQPRGEATSLDFLIRTTNNTSTSGYIINKSYITSNTSQNEYALYPALGSCGGPETMNEKTTSTESHLSQPQFDFLICVQSCHARQGKNPDLVTNLKDICIKDQPITYYYYIGDPNLPTEFSINERDRIITLRCKDDYLNLCNKFGQLLHALRTILSVNKCFRLLKGIFFIDDDITMVVPAVLPFLQKNQNEAYWGLEVAEMSQTNHMKSKVKQSEMIRKQVDPYPGLLKHSVEVTRTKYCAGCAYYVRKDVVLAISETADDLFAPFPDTQDELDTYLNSDNRYSSKVCLIEDLNVGAAITRLGFSITRVDLKKKDLVLWYRM